MALLDWVSSSTQLLSTQFLSKLDLPINCCFASTPNVDWN